MNKCCDKCKTYNSNGYDLNICHNSSCPCHQLQEDKVIIDLGKEIEDLTLDERTVRGAFMNVFLAKADKEQLNRIESLLTQPQEEEFIGSPGGTDNFKITPLKEVRKRLKQLKQEEKRCTTCGELQGGGEYCSNPIHFSTPTLPTDWEKEFDKLWDKNPNKKKDLKDLIHKYIQQAKEEVVARVKEMTNKGYEPKIILECIEADIAFPDFNLTQRKEKE